MYEDIHWFHTTPETEGTTEQDYPIGEQIPYCSHWETVRQISNGYEPSVVLGNQQQTLQDIMGFTSIFPDFESTEGVDGSDWWEWNSGF